MALISSSIRPRTRCRADSLIKAISVGYKPRDICVFGWRTNWLVVYVALTMVFMLCLKTRVRRSAVGGLSGPPQPRRRSGRVGDAARRRGMSAIAAATPTFSESAPRRGRDSLTTCIQRAIAIASADKPSPSAPSSRASRSLPLDAILSIGAACGAGVIAEHGETGGAQFGKGMRPIGGLGARNAQTGAARHTHGFAIEGVAAIRTEHDAVDAEREAVAKQRADVVADSQSVRARRGVAAGIRAIPRLCRNGGRSATARHP